MILRDLVCVHRRDGAGHIAAFLGTVAGRDDLLEQDGLPRKSKVQRGRFSRADGHLGRGDRREPEHHGAHVIRARRHNERETTLIASDRTDASAGDHHAGADERVAAGIDADRTGNAPGLILRHRGQRAE